MCACENQTSERTASSESGLTRQLRSGTVLYIIYCSRGGKNKIIKKSFITSDILLALMAAFVTVWPEFSLLMMLALHLNLLHLSFSFPSFNRLFLFYFIQYSVRKLTFVEMPCGLPV